MPTSVVLDLDPQQTQWKQGSLLRDPDFSCAGCLGKVRPIDGRLVQLRLRTGCSHAVQIGLGQVPPTTPSPHQSQSATFDQKSSVFNLCTATCSRNLCNDWLHFVACSSMTVQ